MSVKVTGIRDVDRVINKVDRRITRERQVLVRKAATKTLVPAMRSRAKSSPGKAGPILARGVSARNGKRGAVLIGPRGGKRGAWWRHFFIGGAPPHKIGKPGQVLYNPAAAFVARAPVAHPGIRPNPFVTDGAESAQRAFVDAVGAAIVAKE